MVATYAIHRVIPRGWPPADGSRSVRDRRMAKVADHCHAQLPVAHRTTEESMLREIIAIAESTVSRCLKTAGRVVQRLLEPVSATSVAGVVQDAVRSNSECVAESAMLRQQLIVWRAARSSVPPFATATVCSWSCWRG